eukprot:CAMPEP_0197722342 /NCGR_PEP_ID=MMETSP1434-20131217/5069_1 /TAXON_ID=265543 /ORGANISM="Minutocellus polymorphus, Strain CCMP3303" /LENGTH=38 /DNA_ID= /DNA_START= /DNA_END= /DNA_ORIENTATION=
MAELSACTVTGRSTNGSPILLPRKKALVAGSEATLSKL